MKKISGSRQVLIVIIVFVFSRIISMFIGLHLNIWALSAYWQYLDIETLRNNLLTGLWYDHAQPPVFNLFLGLVLKTGGNHSALLFAVILMGISLINAILLLYILKKLVIEPLLPLLVALAYILSPATLVFECELFYTTTISLLLLLSTLYLIRLSKSPTFWNAFGFVFPLAVLCLTRSLYHFFWLFLMLTVFLFYFRKKTNLNNLMLASLTGIILVGSWYVKNKVLFGKLTASTWIGMNMARNVFHDNDIKDSSRIEAYDPFSKISVYGKFLDPLYEKSFKGWNDRDLLQEMKNDSFINETAVSYIPVSGLYQKASMEYIKSHPAKYARNVLQSGILYFTPATVYSLAVEQAAKIKYYDLPFSFNLTHFAKGKQARRILLTVSAFPKMFVYLFVIFILIQNCIRSKFIAPWNLFILVTIGYVFGISSLFEHYENMRFRFETEPLFMILAAQVLSILYERYQARRRVIIRN